MRKLLLSGVILALLLSAGSLFPQQSAATKLPDTPAGRQCTKFFQAIESGEHETYIKNNFAAAFLERFSMQEHLDFFRQVSTMHGGFDVHAVTAASDYEISVLAKSKKRDAWRQFEIATESSPPYRLIGLGIDTADPPGAESTPKMTEAEILSFAEKELQKLVDEDKFSGAILIAKDDRPLFRRAYGMASKRFGVPNKPDTKFNLGSINKSFTELAIAQLLEQEKIQLEDTIGKYLDGFPRDVAEKVTILHLLTMRSGMGGYWNDEYWSKWATIRTVDDLMDIIKDEPLAFEPGASRRYSNSGFVVLGAIIEKVSGQSYYDYVRQHIFQPAGMHDTDSYEMDQIVPNLAIGYTANRSPNPYNDNKLQNNLFLHGVKGSPAGGGYSTVDDLLKYVQALKANKLAGRKYTNLVLDLYGNVDDPERRPTDFGIAGGAPVGINAAIEADLESGYTVIVLSNYDPPTAEDLAMRFFKLLQNRKSS